VAESRKPQIGGTLEVGMENPTDQGQNTHKKPPMFAHLINRKREKRPRNGWEEGGL